MGTWGALTQQRSSLKEVPDASKQADWKGSKPEKFDWDKEIDEVLEAGKEIPEVDWLKPGQDAAWKVG